MKSGKAGGKNGVLPEFLKICGCALSEQLHQLFCKVWEEGCVPQEWKDALVMHSHSKEGLLNPV